MKSTNTITNVTHYLEKDLRFAHGSEHWTGCSLHAVEERPARPRDGNLRQQTWTAAGPAHAVARVFEAHTHSARSARLSSAGVLFHARLVLSAYNKLTILVVPKPFAGIFIMLE